MEEFKLEELTVEDIVRVIVGYFDMVTNSKEGESLREKQLFYKAFAMANNRTSEAELRAWKDLVNYSQSNEYVANDSGEKQRFGEIIRLQAIRNLERNLIEHFYKIPEEEKKYTNLDIEKEIF